VTGPGTADTSTQGVFSKFLSHVSDSGARQHDEITNVLHQKIARAGIIDFMLFPLPRSASFVGDIIY
jgi:hypothetical protein